jgi:hypothetical protein
MIRWKLTPERALAPVRTFFALTLDNKVKLFVSLGCSCIIRSFARIGPDFICPNTIQMDPFTPYRNPLIIRIHLITISEKILEFVF